MEKQELLLLKALESLSQNPGDAQDKILGKILEANATTQYFQQHGLEAATKQVFQQKAPIIDYEDIKNEIYRIADGDDHSLLCNKSITDIFTSSGTSGGASKLFPQVEGYFATIRTCFARSSALLNRDVPEARNGKALYFHYVRSSTKTPGGLPAYPALTGYYSSEAFRRQPFDPGNDLTSPMEVILCTDTAQVTYCHLLCGLIHAQEVTKLGCFFAGGLVRAIRSLEKFSQDLSRDLRRGTLSNDRVVDPVLRRAVEKILQPNPELAAVLEEACAGSMQGIVRKLWPNARVVDTVITGSMEQYAGLLDYLTDGLPIASMAYASSESFFGVNVHPLCDSAKVSYMLLPDICYYEFLPVTPSKLESNEEPVELADLEKGQEYELVVTTEAGLYRYRMGDVLKVEGFYNKAPLLSFVCRRNVLLSIDADKTGEKDLQTSVMNGFGVLRSSKAVGEGEAVSLTDYSSYADFSTNPPHYVIYWELSSSKVKQFLMEAEVGGECCYKMEESLSGAYQKLRMENSIGALELRLVKPGTFDRLAGGGGNVAQFKLPRCINKNATAILEAVESGVFNSFFSPRAPKCGKL